MAKAVGDELDQFRALHQARPFELNVSGDTLGHWDGSRLQQLLRNLVSNAVKYGLPNSPVRVTIRGEPSQICLEVANSGHIDPTDVRQLFDPLRRGAAANEVHDTREGLGLGLFIVQEIAKAHGGEVTVSCEGNLTTFTMRLPRRSPASQSEQQA